MSKKDELVFVAKDFEDRVLQKYLGSIIDGKIVNCVEAAEIANDKFAQWAAGLSPAYFFNKQWIQCSPGVTIPNAEFSARLAFIQPIERVKCVEHEPTTKNTQQIFSKGPMIDALYGSTVVCAKCGIKLVTRWEAAE